MQNMFSLNMWWNCDVRYKIVESVSHQKSKAVYFKLLLKPMLQPLGNMVGLV